jgi:hypothetical protein
MSDSYQQEKQLAAQLSGETSSSLPFRNNIETLHALKTLAPNSSAIDNLVNEELRFFQASAEALSKSPYLQQKFGSGLEAVALLAPLMKQVQAQETTLELLKPHLPTQRPWIQNAKKGGINWSSSAPTSNP